ncbi:MAG TPA: hypothetical protein VM712_08580, partial [Gaiellales bacterium]|nr:hypothetical protein [Gaiellales bacterium]
MTTAVEPTETAELTVEHVVTRAPVSRAQRLGAGISLVVLGLVTIWRFGIEGHHDQDASIRLGAVGAENVPHFTVPAVPVAWVAGVLTILLGIVWLLVPRRRWFGPIMGAGIFLFVVALICWLASASEFSTFDVVGTLTSSIGLAVPLILGALCGVMCERSAVINVAIEGQMLAGAWASALIGTLLGVTAGLFAGAFAGALLGALLAVFAIRYLVNQVVLGVVLNLLVLGLTGYLYRSLMQQDPQTYNSPATLAPIRIPGLADIPILGPLLFNA